jgi:hypothetical protein
MSKINKLRTPMAPALFKPRTQLFWMSVLDTGLILIWLGSLAMLIYFFASMNTRGLLNTGVVLFGAQIGYTSLLYNRARTFDEGTVRRRTIIAAEIALRATMLYLAVFAIASAAFAALSSAGYQETKIDWNSTPFFANAALAPLIASIVLVFLLQINFFILHRSFVVLVRRNFGLGRIRLSSQRTTKAK